MSKEAMKLALEALNNTYALRDDVIEAIKALEEALAKQEQGEPVAHFGSAYVNENGVHITTVLGPVAIPQDAKLYLEPQQRKPLTKKKIDELADEGCFLGNIYEITAEIEAAHDIKE